MKRFQTLLSISACAATPRDSGDQSPGDHQSISFADDTVFEKPETGGDIPEDDEITPLMVGTGG